MNKSSKKNEYDEDYDIEEVEEKFGGSFSEITSKVIKNSSPKKKKVIKFRKDGHYDSGK
jgi:hypothetical protein